MTTTTKISTGRVSINTTTSVEVVPANSGRSKLRLQFPNSSIFVGADSNLTSSNGYQLFKGSNNDAELETKAAIYALADGSSHAVTFLELHD